MTHDEVMADNRGFLYLAAIAATYIIAWTLLYVRIMGWDFGHYLSDFVSGLSDLGKLNGFHLAATAITLIVWTIFFLIRWARR